MAWKLSRERDVSSVLCAPGNPGIASVAQCVPADLTKPQQLLSIAAAQDVDLTVVGPETPLSLGVADLFTEAKVAWFKSRDGGAGISPAQVIGSTLGTFHCRPFVADTNCAKRSLVTGYRSIQNPSTVTRCTGRSSG